MKHKAFILFLIIGVALLFSAGCKKNTAPNTPSKPEGRTLVGKNAINEYTTSATDPNNDEIRYIFDWGDNILDTTIDYASGATATASHAWADTGTFSVKVRAQDKKDALSVDWSEPLEVKVVLNSPPHTPQTPVGPSKGRPDIKYTFTTIVTDPDNDSVAVKFDWGNGRTPVWTNFFTSGDTIADTITYTADTVVSIKVVAKDTKGDTSAWSSGWSFEVSAGAWSFTTGLIGEDVNSSPALILDGSGAVASIVFGCSDGFVYCLDTFGLMKWQFPSPDSNEGDAFNASPAVGTNGVVYIGNEDGEFFAINPDGTEKWRFTVGGGNEFNSSPALDEPDERLYVGCENETLYALNINNNGSRVWAYGAQDIISSSPAIASDGAIVFGDEGDSGRVYILNQDGSERRIFIADGPIYSSPAISGTTIYFGASDTFFYGLPFDSTLPVLKTIPVTSQGIHASPSIGLNNVIYFGTDDGNLYALNSADLTPLASWQAPYIGEITSSAAIGADGLVYIVSDDYTLYGYDATTGNEDWSVRITTGKRMRGKQDVLTPSPVIGPNHWVYTASDVGLYAFNRNTTLAATAWPMFRRNIQHTGVQ